MSRIVGIDLGTTNSLVAYMDHGTPRVIAARHERAMVPSVVALTDNGLIVGDSAKEHLTRNPERTVYSVKRFMGRRHHEVENEEKLVPSKVVGGAAEYVKIGVGDRTYTPQEISAKTLPKLKESAEAPTDSSNHAA